jgi:hypothetical protein
VIRFSNELEGERLRAVADFISWLPPSTCSLKASFLARSTAVCVPVLTLTYSGQNLDRLIEAIGGYCGKPSIDRRFALYSRYRTYLAHRNGPTASETQGAAGAVGHPRSTSVVFVD